MDKRFWICGLTISATALVLGFLVHGVILRADYLALAHLFRPRSDANANVGWILLAYAALGLGMTWLYRWLPPPVRRKRWHGSRFGLAIALDGPAMLLLGLLLAWLQPHRRALAVAPD